MVPTHGSRALSIRLHSSSSSARTLASTNTGPGAAIVGAVARDSAALEHAKQLGLGGEGHLADLIEESARRRRSRGARFCLNRAREGAPSCPKSWASSSVSTSAASFTYRSGCAAVA